jgi:hypothetical protein
MKGASLVWGVAGSTPPASPCIVASMRLIQVEHMDPKTARERGWNGETHTVRCSHIRQLLNEAQRLVNQVDGATFPVPAPGGEVEGSRNALLVMERAENLLEHAAQELRDERLCLRDGWSF